ncbi:MAG: metallophosphoesterase [Myxococcota bacterium]
MNAARVLFGLAAFAVAASLHIYVWRRLVRDPQWSTTVRRTLTACALILAAAMVTMMSLSRHVEREVVWPLPLLTWSWLGVLFYLLLFTFAADVGRWSRRLWARVGGEAPAAPQAPAVASEGVSRRVFGQKLAAGLSAATTLGVGVHGFYSARGEFYVPETEVKIPRLAPSLEGLRVVLLSDIHIGPTLGGAFIDRIVERTNSLRPDLVAITGDLVDGSVALIGDEVGRLSRLKSRYGTFFSTGNHEFYSGAQAWMTHLERAGVTVLANSRQRVGDDGGTIEVVGIHDLQGARFAPHFAPDLATAMTGADPEAATLLLSHQPRAIGLTDGFDVDLQLAGHTHAGQLWPFGGLTRLVQPYIQGLHSHNAATQIYVSGGTGYWGPPMRVGAPPEIALLHLTG